MSESVQEQLGRVPGVSDPARLAGRLTEGESLIGAWTTCENCGRRIQPVVVWSSGYIDWEDNGDSGCAESPDTNADGTGSHVPTGD